jgi:adenylylsulfate kinase
VSVAGEAGGVVVWFTGRPSSGKSTLAAELQRRLEADGRGAVLLDSDDVRAVFRPAVGYGDEERSAFYATLAGLAALIARQGHVVLVPATAHRRTFRMEARSMAPRFVEVYVATDAAECARRDTKDLYRRVAAGELEGVPGADVEYEIPESPEVVAAGGRDEAALSALRRLL